jgi:hypothetical protein
MTTKATAIIPRLKRLGSRSRQWNLSLIERDRICCARNHAAVYFHYSLGVCDDRHKDSKNNVEKSSQSPERRVEPHVSHANTGCSIFENV